MLSRPFPHAGTYVVGATRTGKSTLLANLLLEDHEQGKTIVLIDPKAELCDTVFGHLSYPRVLDVASANFSLDVLHCNDPEDPGQVDLTLDRLMQIFAKVFRLDRNTTPRLRQYLRNSAVPLVVTQSTLGDLPSFLMDPSKRGQVLSHVPRHYFPQVHEFWSMHNNLSSREKLDRIESTIDRVDEFLGGYRARMIFSNHSELFDWEYELGQGDVVLVRLAPQLEQLSDFVGAVVMGQLASTLMGRSERYPIAIYCDEYHRFATASTNDLLTMGGGFGIEVTVAHQARSQFDTQTKGSTLQCGNKFVFRVHPPDNDELAGEFEVPEDEGRVIGRIAKQVVSQEPVAVLRRGLHSNREVQQLAMKRLVPLLDRLKISDEFAEANLKTGDRYGRNLDQIASLNATSLNAYRLMNRCLAGVQTHRVFPSQDLCLAVADILMALQEEIHRIRNWNWSDYTKRCLTVGVKTQLLAPYPEKQAAYLANCDWTDEERTQARKDPWFFYRRIYLKDKNDPTRLEDHVARLTDLTDLFGQLAYQLWKEPIMVETDQFEEIRERPRSVSDRSAEIANKLPSLPLGVAWAKIWLGGSFQQQEIQTPPPPPFLRGYQSLPIALTQLEDPLFFDGFSTDEPPPT